MMKNPLAIIGDGQRRQVDHQPAESKSPTEVAITLHSLIAANLSRNDDDHADDDITLVPRLSNASILIGEYLHQDSNSATSIAPSGVPLLHPATELARHLVARAPGDAVIAKFGFSLSLLPLSFAFVSVTQFWFLVSLLLFSASSLQWFVVVNGGTRFLTGREVTTDDDRVKCLAALDDPTLEKFGFGLDSEFEGHLRFVSSSVQAQQR
jgi:hypothetical protein